MRIETGKNFLFVYMPPKLYTNCRWARPNFFSSFDFDDDVEKTSHRIQKKFVNTRVLIDIVYNIIHQRS
jgi:hypothetical protein